LQTRQVLALVTVAAIIALAFGVSIGYSRSSSKVSTSLEIQTSVSTFTQLSTTVAPTAVIVSGQTYQVITATEKPVLVAQYTPACSTINGQVTTVYSEVALAESTTVTLIFPSLLSPGWGEFLVTVTTNNTNTFSSQIENTTISC